MRPQQVSNANFFRSLFLPAVNDVISRDISRQGEDYNHSGINSVFDFERENNVYYTMKVPSEFMKEFNELTLMAWVHPTKKGDIRIFDSSVAGVNVGGFGFDLYMDKVRFLGSRRDNVISANCQSSVGSITTGEWNHCCVTFKNGELKFYINGALDTTRHIDPKVLDPPLKNKLCIGYSMADHPGSGNYKGFMSQLSVWNVALSDAMVETCSKKNLLLLKEKEPISDNQFFIDPELYNLFQKHALIYLPYLKWNNSKIQNFGVCTENLDIMLNNPRLDKKKLSTSTTSVISSGSNIEKVHSITKDVYWIQELHQHFSIEKRNLITFLMLSANRQAPIIGELPEEVLEVIFSFLD